MGNTLNTPNVVKDRLISSPLEKEWTPIEVEGSFYLTLASVVEDHIKTGGDWTWLNDVITGEKLTAKEGLSWGKRFAAFFESVGFQNGDAIHFVLGNFNLAFPACFGTWILGGVPSLGDVNLEARAIARQLEDVNAKIVLFVPEFSDLVSEAINLLEEKSKIKTFCFGKVSWCKDIYEELGRFESKDCPNPYVSHDPRKEPAIIFWSSGTTGHPKGIVHSHHTALNLPGLSLTFPTINSNIVTTTCFFHVGGFFTATLSLMQRLTYYHMFGTSVTLDLILDTIIKARPKQVILGTHHYVQLAESSILDKADTDDLDFLEVIGPAGAAVPESCEALFMKKFRNLKGVLYMYGQTEVGIVCGRFSSKALGTVFPGIQVKIVNVETGEHVRPGQEGEICVKSDHSIMIGYLNRPQESKEFFDSEGFGRTGDLGYYDEDGDIFYVDRMKEIMKYRNNHVSPTELEGILQRHEAVQESLVFGKPDPRVQEIITAVVILKPGYTASEEDLVSFVNNQVTDYKKIRGGIIFRKEIPRNSVGKLVRRELREWAKMQMDQQKKHTQMEKKI